MATDKELQGIQFKVSGPSGTIFDAFVAQADPNIGITVDFMDLDDMKAKGIHVGNEAHYICISKEGITAGRTWIASENYTQAYEEMKSLIMQGSIVKDIDLRLNHLRKRKTELELTHERLYGSKLADCAFE